MKVLIAGATGLIGQEIVRQCHEKKIEVHFLTTRRGKIVQESNYKGFYWNPDNEEIDTDAFKDVDAIINLAGASVSKRWTTKYKKLIVDSRVDSAMVIKNALEKMDHQVEHYLSASGISIFPSSKDHLYTEDETVVGNSFLAKVTEKWEAVADRFSELGIKVTKIRTGIVLDREEGALPQIVKPIKMGIGAPLASGEQWQSWIHIKDIAGIYLFLLEHKIAGVFNGVAPSPASNKKMTKLIAQELDKPLWIPKVPAFALKLLLGEMSDLVLESQLVCAKKIEDAGYRFHYVNLEKALEDLLP